MEELNINRATHMYNTIMMSLGYEHNTIGTALSEDTENWNIRDMVAECDYTLSCYYESGHCNNDLRYSDDPEEREMWETETTYLKRFIKKYAPYTKGVKCYIGHCSNYDN